MRRFPSALRLLVPAALALAAVSPAEAEARERRGRHTDKDYYVPHPTRQVYGLHAYWWSASPYGSTFPFVLFGRSEFTSNVFFDFELPWTFTAHTDRDPIAAVGNPTLVIRYADRVNDVVSWTVGGGLSAPMGAVDDPEFRLALGAAALGTALQNPYLWSVASMPLLVRAGVEVRLAPPLFLRVGLDPIFAIPLESQDAVFASQQHAELEVKAPASVGGGVALHALTTYVPDVPDRAQLSTEAFFSYDDEEEFFFRFGLLLALDEPAGFGFDTGKAFTGHVLVGGYFEEDD